MIFLFPRWGYVSSLEGIVVDNPLVIWHSCRCSWIFFSDWYVRFMGGEYWVVMIMCRFLILYFFHPLPFMVGSYSWCKKYGMYKTLVNNGINYLSLNWWVDPGFLVNIKTGGVCNLPSEMIRWSPACVACRLWMRRRNLGILERLLEAIITLVLTFDKLCNIIIYSNIQAKNWWCTLQYTFILHDAWCTWGSSLIANYLCNCLEAAKPPGDPCGPASWARSNAIHAARWSGVAGVWG